MIELTPEMRAAATGYINRTRNDAPFLLNVLGLAVEPVPPLAEGRKACQHCGRGVSLDGRCRRSSCYPGVLAAKAAGTR